MNELQQKAICDQHGAEFLPPVPGSRVGIAVETLGLQPLNGMRIDPGSGVCGWFLWGGGEPSDADDFYKPMCVEHVAKYCPAALSLLALPPGWRFLTDGNCVDVWFDAALTGRRREAASMERKKREVDF
jgi:hypothetical protein